MHFVLVHGWGFDAHIWDDLVPHLGEAEITRVDLGFLHGGPPAPDVWPREAIAIGHSLGVLWLLHEGKARFRGLVSLQGFDCFACHVGRGRLLSMRRSLLRDPYGLMQMFWRSCGALSYAEPERLDAKRLEQGLDWLLNWDERKTLTSLDRPVLALASKDDSIVPEAMSQAIWGEHVRWSKDAKHLLPRRHPAWCAEQICKFAEELENVE